MSTLFEMSTLINVINTVLGNSFYTFFCFPEASKIFSSDVKYSGFSLGDARFSLMYFHLL